MRTLLCILMLTACVAFAETTPADCAYRIHNVTVEGSGVTEKIFVSKGTGFGLDKHHILTACHVAVKPGSRVMVEIGSRWVDCSIERCDPEFDLALLKCDVDVPHFADLDAHQSLAGEVCIYGSPQGDPIREYKGSLTDDRRGALWAGAPGFMRVFDVQVALGCSGAPVFKGGVIVGIFLAHTLDRELACVLSARRIRQFLTERE